MKSAYNGLLEKTRLVQKEFQELVILPTLILVHEIPAGESRFTTYDFSQFFYRHKHYSERAIYFLEGCARNILELLQDKRLESKDFIAFPIYDQTLFYFFDAFLVFSYSLFEKPFKEDAQRLFLSPAKQRFLEVFPDEKNVDGLFWRFNLLRNRVLHVDFSTYTDEGHRYEEFRSWGIAQIEKGILTITVPYYDLKENPTIREQLGEYLAKGKKGRFHEKIFPRGSPIGTPEKTFIVSLLKQFKALDLIGGFSDLANEILSYIHLVNESIFEEFEFQMNEKGIVIPRGNLANLKEHFPA